MYVIHTSVHWWRWLPCKVPPSTGAVWGSESCPRTLQHADQGIRTSDPMITRHRLHDWASAAYVYGPSRAGYIVMTSQIFKSPQESWTNIKPSRIFCAVWGVLSTVLQRCDHCAKLELQKMAGNVSCPPPKKGSCVEAPLIGQAALLVR